MANELEITTKFIPHLRNQFSRGAVVLFTGAGFSLDAANQAGVQLPSMIELTRELWNICYSGEEFDETTQLQDIFDAAIQVDRTATAELMRNRFTVDAKQCPDYYMELLAMPWARIYTLNVDDLLERVIDEIRLLRPIRSVSATTGHITDVHDESLSIVHLNGSLKDVPDDVTFARSQYAGRRSRDPFYEALRHDLVSRPVVFIGSNLEEGPMWQHFEMRGGRPSRGERELRPRNYLVTPRLNKSKQALLSKYQIEWLPMTTKEFCREILSAMDEARNAGNAFLLNRQKWSKEYGSKIQRIADIPEGTKEPTEYLLGAEPEWVDAKQRRIAYRVCFDDIVNEINRMRAGSSVNEFLIVTGTAGTGKSSALMTVALRMEAEGVPTAWIDNTQRFDVYGFRKALEEDPGIGILCIADADVYGKRLSRLVRDGLDTIERLIIVCECRSTKVDSIIDRSSLRGIQPVEYTIPNLEDNDIEAILDVLDRENRLGVLKGLSRDERRRVFKAEAGRQMLVAMYKATHGEDFRDKAINELNGLDDIHQFLYGLVCVAHAHRFMLTRDEIAIACGDDIEEWPRALDSLLRRKVILPGPGETYKARHREIAQFLYTALSQHGRIAAVIRALIKIAGTKTSPHMKRGNRPQRMLSTFNSHKLIKRTVGLTVGRQIYNEFEYLLDWNYHYWLQRGALELEIGGLGAAENFLNQSKAIEPNDIFVDNELAYLKFKKANIAPQDINSQRLVDEALETLSAIGIRRRDQRPHVAHIAGSQGLIWARQTNMAGPEKQLFLEMLLKEVRAALPDDEDDILATLETDLNKELLSLAVPTQLPDRG